MGKKQTTKQIALEQAYKKELKRIKQFMRRAEKRGYRWYYYELPKKPKKITEKSVSRLKKITPDLLYKKGEYIEQDTGEILDAVKGRTIERKRAAQKAAETYKQKKNRVKNEKQKQEHPKAPKHETTEPIYDEPYYGESDKYLPNYSEMVINNVYELIDSFNPGNFHSKRGANEGMRNRDRLRMILDSSIEKFGADAVAKRLNENASEIAEIVDKAMYHYEEAEIHISRFATILNGGPLSASQAAEFAEMSEQSENWEFPS